MGRDALHWPGLVPKSRERVWQATSRSMSGPFSWGLSLPGRRAPARGRCRHGARSPRRPCPSIPAPEKTSLPSGNREARTPGAAWNEHRARLGTDPEPAAPLSELRRSLRPAGLHPPACPAAVPPGAAAAFRPARSVARRGRSWAGARAEPAVPRRAWGGGDGRRALIPPRSRSQAPAMEEESMEEEGGGEAMMDDQNHNNWGAGGYGRHLLGERLLPPAGPPRPAGPEHNGAGLRGCEPGAAAGRAGAAGAIAAINISASTSKFRECLRTGGLAFATPMWGSPREASRREVRRAKVPWKAQITFARTAPELLLCCHGRCGCRPGRVSVGRVLGCCFFWSLLVQIVLSYRLCLSAWKT